MAEPLQFERRALIFIFITVALDAIGLGIIIPVLPDLLKEVMQVNVSTAAWWGGLLTASYAVTQFIFGPLLGSLSDRFGRRPVLLLGLVFLCIDYLIMGFANTIWWLLLGRLLAGAAGSTFVTANALIADVSPPDKRAANFGMIGAAFGLGFVLGPVIGGLLGEFGTRAPFFAAAFLAAANFLFGYFVLSETLTTENRRAFSWGKANPFAALWMIKRFPALGWIFLALFLFDTGHYVYPAVWAYWGQEVLSWSSFDIGLSLAAVGVGFAVVQGWLIRLVMPRFGETRTVLFSLAVTILSLVAFGFIDRTWLVYAVLPLTALGAMLTPAITGILSNAVAEDEQGVLQGVISGLAAIATIISPLMMTGLFYHFTSEASIRLPGAPFLAAALLCLLAMAVFVLGVRAAGSVDNAR
ncbi:MAG: TCR/Tet family MFS transporter [Gammaproteobacteria bacterium]|nr:TCR/Tet family MFS transporter [Gammaproteobacteria bacterium]